MKITVAKETIATTTSTGKLLYTLMSAIAQFEWDVIADRTREGLNATRARGRTGGRPRANSESVKKAVRLLIRNGIYSVPARRLSIQSGGGRHLCGSVKPTETIKRFYNKTSATILS